MVALFDELEAEEFDLLEAEDSILQTAYLASIAYNLVRSGNLAGYYKILTDFNFLLDKIQHPEFGVQALITDYDLIDDRPQPPLEKGECVSLNPEKVKTLKLIQAALRLSAHVLAKDKTQLAGQLWGRMQRDVPEIQELLSQAKQSKTTWLRPMTPSLTPAGGRLLRTLEGEGHRCEVKTVALTPDGKKAISGSQDCTFSRDYALKVWNLETGELVHTLQGHSGLVDAVALTPDGKTAISGSYDTTLKVWNLETGEELRTLTGHEDPVYAVAMTRDGTKALSSSNRTFKQWNLETGEELLSLTDRKGLVYAVAMTPDGKRVIYG